MKAKRPEIKVLPLNPYVNHYVELQKALILDMRQSFNYNVVVKIEKGAGKTNLRYK